MRLCSCDACAIHASDLAVTGGGQHLACAQIGDVGAEHEAVTSSFRCGLEELDRIAGRIIEQNLLAALTGDDVVPKAGAAFAELLDFAGELTVAMLSSPSVWRSRRDSPTEESELGGAPKLAPGVNTANRKRAASSTRTILRVLLIVASAGVGRTVAEMLNDETLQGCWNVTWRRIHDPQKIVKEIFEKCRDRAA